MFIYRSMNGWFFFFFFQAEDGIRDGRVTGVQTCALPISVDVLPALWANTSRARHNVIRASRSRSTEPGTDGSACSASAATRSAASVALIAGAAPARDST